MIGHKIAFIMLVRGEDTGLCIKKGEIYLLERKQDLGGLLCKRYPISPITYMIVQLDNYRFSTSYPSLRTIYNYEGVQIAEDIEEGDPVFLKALSRELFCWEKITSNNVVLS